MLWAIVKLQLEGEHRWIKAPSEVAFLRNLHRHVFHIEAWVEQVPEVDRDVEYITLKRQLKKVKRSFLPNDKCSCEDIAHNVKNWITENYEGRQVKVFVYEDGENGCCLE